MAVMNPDAVGWGMIVSDYQDAEVDWAGRYLTFPNGFLDFFDLHLAETFDLRESLAGGSMHRLGNE